MRTWEIKQEDGSIITIESTHALWQGDNVVLFYNLNPDDLSRDVVSIRSGVASVTKVETS